MQYMNPYGACNPYGCAGMGSGGMTQVEPPELQLHAGPSATAKEIPSVLDKPGELLSVIKGRKLTKGELLDHLTQVEIASNPLLSCYEARKIAKAKHFGEKTGILDWISCNKLLAAGMIGFGLFVAVPRIKKAMAPRAGWQRNGPRKKKGR